MLCNITSLPFRRGEAKAIHAMHFFLSTHLWWPTSKCDQRPTPSSQAPVASFQHCPWLHWYAALHIMLHIPGGVPHIDGQLDPQSFQI